MSIENPPTENPDDFNNGLDFNPNFYNNDITLTSGITPSNIKNYAITYPTAQDNNILFPNQINVKAIGSTVSTFNIGTNLTTGDEINIGSADTITTIPGKLKVTNRIITPKIESLSTSSIGYLFDNIETNNIIIGSRLSLTNFLQLGSFSGDTNIYGKNIQLSNSSDSIVRCVAPFLVNEIRVLDGSYMDVGSNASSVQIGNEVFSNVFLGGVGGSSVLISSELTCKTYLGTADNANISLFNNLITGGINLFTRTAETFIGNVLKIGNINNQVRFLASALTSDQVIPDNSYDKTISTTEWVTNFVSTFVGSLFTNLYTGDNTFEGNNTFTKPIILNYSGIGANDTTKLGYCEYYETTPFIAVFDGVNSFFKFRKNFPGSPIITGSYLVNVSLTFNVNLDYLKIFIARVKETTPFAPNLAYDTYTGAKEAIDTGTIIIDTSGGGGYFRANNRVSTSCVVPITSAYDTIAIILNAQPTGGSQECTVLNSWSITRIG